MSSTKGSNPGKVKKYFLQKGNGEVKNRKLSPINCVENPMRHSMPIFIDKKKQKNLMQNIIKCDIMEIEEYINNNKEILTIIKEERESILNNKEFKKKFNFIENKCKLNLEEQLQNIEITAREISKLKDKYACDNENELIVLLAIENSNMELLIEKIDILCFLMNLTYYDQTDNFQDINKDTISKCANVIELINQLININSFKCQLGESYNQFSSQMSFPIQQEKNISSDIQEFKNSISSMKAFSQFLAFECQNPEINNICIKIRDLFYDYNNKSFSFMFEFFDKLKIKDPLVNKIKSALRNKIIDMTQYSLLIKPIQEYLDKINDENKTLKSNIDNCKIQIEKLEKELAIMKKKSDFFNNIDYKKFYSQVREENLKFLSKIEDIIKKDNIKVCNKIDEKIDKYSTMKSQIKTLKAEVEYYKNKNERLAGLPNKEKDEYYKALLVQFEDMKTGFLEKMSDKDMEYNKKRGELQKKINILQNEKKLTKEFDSLLKKKISDIDKYFNL